MQIKFSWRVVRAPHHSGINPKEIQRMLEEIDNPENFQFSLWTGTASSIPYSIETTVGIIVEVIANFKFVKTPAVPTDGIMYLGCHFQRFNQQLFRMHPELMTPIFDRLESVLQENPRYGAKLLGTLAVVWED